MSRARSTPVGPAAPPGEAAPFGPGYHGKVPARGDFISFDLPGAFLEPWDAWLRAALVESRANLGPAWERLFAASPVWRFVLAPGLCGGPGVAGVLVPSADRVGRLYPFTLAASLPAGTELAAVPFGCAPWFSRAETLALAACQDGADPDDAVPALLALGRPDPGFAAHNPLHHERLAGMVGTLPERPSLWWTRGGHWVASSMVACRGLPAGGRFAAFLDNGWARWGWDDVNGAAAPGREQGLPEQDP